MSYLKLSKRAKNGKLIKYANFADGSYINLIDLRHPYSTGERFAVHETTKSPFCSNGLYRTIEKANEKFDLMVKNGQIESELIKAEVIDNTIIT